MQTVKVVVLVGFSLTLLACGGMGTGPKTNANLNSSANMDGNWTVMMDQNGVQAMSFTTALNQSSGNVVTATNIQFTTPTNCFATGTSGTGAVMPSNDMMNGSMMQSFGMTVQSANMTQSGSMGMPMGMIGSNVLTLQGSMSNMNTISGTWTMSGMMSGCSGSGTFIMTRM